MKKLFILALAATMMAGCAGRLGNKTNKLINDGHDYQWVIFFNSPHFIHSPECDTCKAIRKEEIKQYVDSVVNERIIKLLKDK